MNKYTKYLKFIPKPEVEHIRIKDIDLIDDPHPYVVNDQGSCEMCEMLVNSGRQDRIYSREEHVQEPALVIEVPPKDINEISGLKEYLVKVKDALRSFKIDKILCVYDKIPLISIKNFFE